MKALIAQGIQKRTLSTVLRDSYSEQDLKKWKAHGLLPEELVTQVESVLDKKKQISDNRKVIQRLKSQMDKVYENQKRIRENIKAMMERMSDSGLIKRYLKDMEKQEDELVLAIQKKDKAELEIEEFQAALQELKFDLNQSVKELQRQYGISTPNTGNDIFAKFFSCRKRSNEPIHEPIRQTKTSAATYVDAAATVFSWFSTITGSEYRSNASGAAAESFLLSRRLQ